MSISDLIPPETLEELMRLVGRATDEPYGALSEAPDLDALNNSYYCDETGKIVFWVPNKEPGRGL